MGKHHSLKIWPAYFEQVEEGHKTFEIRINDRGFRSGDTCTLKEWDPKLNRFTGREVSFEIGYVFPLRIQSANGPAEHVVFSLLPGLI